MEEETGGWKERTVAQRQNETGAQRKERTVVWRKEWTGLKELHSRHINKMEN